MRKKGEDGRKFTLRISEKLGNEIDLYVNKSGMTTQDFIRRACWEKLTREKERMQIHETGQVYLSKKYIETLKYALQLPEIQNIILSIVEKRIK